MNMTLRPTRIHCSFRDRDRAAAHARLSALAAALERRGVSTFFAECDLSDDVHAIVLQAGGREGVVIAALARADGSYESHGRGNPPDWLLAHVESAWCEIA